MCKSTKISPGNDGRRHTIDEIRGSDECEWTARIRRLKTLYLLVLCSVAAVLSIASEQIGQHQNTCHIFNLPDRTLRNDTCGRDTKRMVHIEMSGQAVIDSIYLVYFH